MSTETELFHVNQLTISKEAFRALTQDGEERLTDGGYNEDEEEEVGEDCRQSFTRYKNSYYSHKLARNFSLCHFF